MELVMKQTLHVYIQMAQKRSHFNYDGGYDVPDCRVAEKIGGGGHTHPPILET